MPIGQLGGGEQNVEGMTVSTYDSAYLRADDIGDRFGLAIFDEVHHLGGEGYREIARLLAAPARMGLTATFERPDGAHEVVSELVGEKVFDVHVDELAGTHLASYDVKRMTVELTPEERERYEAAQGVFTDYLARSSIQMRSGSDYQELVKRSGSDPKAREALLAKQRARDIMMNSEGKVTLLADLLDAHRDDRIIVFTAHNDLVYRLSERFLIPAITHRTSTPERREILDRFRRGEYSRVITSNVLGRRGRRSRRQRRYRPLRERERTRVHPAPRANPPGERGRRTRTPLRSRHRGDGGSPRRKSTPVVPEPLPILLSFTRRCSLTVLSISFPPRSR